MSGSPSPCEEDLLEEESSQDGERASASSLVGEEEEHTEEVDVAEETKQEADVECDRTGENINKCVSHPDESECSERLEKLSREKKHLLMSLQKLTEELHWLHDKNGGLVQGKRKLETLVDELESDLETERRQTLQSAKDVRRVEAELKLCHEAISEQEKELQEQASKMARKERDCIALAAAVQDHSETVAKIEKELKATLMKLEAAEEDLETERQARGRSEAQRCGRDKEVEELTEHLDEANEILRVRVELLKRRDAEIAQLRSDHEEVAVAAEKTLADLKRRHSEQMTKLEEELEAANKVRRRLEHEKSCLRNEASEAKSHADRTFAEKIKSEKARKTLDATVQELRQKLCECEAKLTSCESGRKRATDELKSVSLHLEESEAKLAEHDIVRSSLSARVEAERKAAAEEAKLHATLMQRHKAVERDNVLLKDALDEEVADRKAIEQQLLKAKAESEKWAVKFSSELSPALEQLELDKEKLESRLSEATSLASSLQSRCHGLEKNRQRWADDVSELESRLEASQHALQQHKRRLKEQDVSLAHAKKTVEDLAGRSVQEQETARTSALEAKRAACELSEMWQALESCRKEQRALSSEKLSLTTRLSETEEKLCREVELRRGLEREVGQAHAALDEARDESEAARMRAERLERDCDAGLRQAQDQLKEKEDEVQELRRAAKRAVEAGQETLRRALAEKEAAQQANAKLATQCRSIECSLDIANKSMVDQRKAIKIGRAKIADLQLQVEREQRCGETLSRGLTATQAKTALLHEELQQLRSENDALKRCKRFSASSLLPAQEAVAKAPPVAHVTLDNI